MRTLFLTLTFVLLVIGCADVLYEDRFVDPRLEPYVESFYREAKARGLDPDRAVVVQFGHIGVLGRSKKKTLSRTVIIDYDWYAYYRRNTPEDIFYYGYENLMFHELGHSVLDLEHCECDEIMSDDGSIFRYAYDMEARERMIDNLFNAKKIQ